MKYFRILLLLSFLLNACIKDKIPEDNIIQPGIQTTGNATQKSPSGTVNICQFSKGTWQIKTININSWPSFRAQGAVRLDDQDGDGYVPNNGCGIGVQGDCNDTNALIHPGVAEICNGFDDDCDGIIDESCYDAVIIGGKVWMSKNLDVPAYRNGDPITDGQFGWADFRSGAWCVYGNDPGNKLTYGRLYNWYAVNDPRGLAPQGWHIPSEHEWILLLKTLDAATDTTNTSSIYSFTAGGKMKEVGVTHWLTPNTGATNRSGFTGLPAGWRDDEGSFSLLGTHTMWWSSTGFERSGGDGSPGTARGPLLHYGNTNVVGFGRTVLYGLPVRCIRD